MSKLSKQLFAMMACFCLAPSAQAERARVPLQYYALSDLTLLKTAPDGKGGGVVVFADPAGVQYRQVVSNEHESRPLRGVDKNGVLRVLIEEGADGDYYERVVAWKLNARIEAPESRVSYRTGRIAAAPAYSHEVNSWIEATIPVDSQAREAWFWGSNGSVYSWCVAREGEQVLARLLDGDFCDPPIERRPQFISCEESCKFVEVDDGWIIGFNRGEWGGAIVWFSTNGQRSALLSRHQVKAFVSRGKHLYAIEGLAHLSLSHGSVIEIAKDGAGRWTVRKKLTLPTAPYAVSLRGDQDLLVTLDGGLIAVGPSWKVSSVLREIPWAGLYPSSSVLSVDGRLLYVGMRQYVGEVRLADGRLRMLLPSDKFAPFMPEQKP